MKLRNLIKSRLLPPFFVIGLVLSERWGNGNMGVEVGLPVFKFIVFYDRSKIFTRLLQPGVTG